MCWSIEESHKDDYRNEAFLLRLFQSGEGSKETLEPLLVPKETPRDQDRGFGQRPGVTAQGGMASKVSVLGRNSSL